MVTNQQPSGNGKYKKMFEKPLFKEEKVAK